MTLKVLIVDDEALARSRLRRLLGQCSAPAAEVRAEAANAAQALQCLAREPFDLALLDIHMPGADGLKLAQLLRERPDAPRVVFVTAHTQHALQAFEVEAVDYLTKPVRLERLQAALEKVQRQRPARPAHEGADDSLLIQERGRTERVPLGEVLFVKAELKYLTVRTTGNCRRDTASSSSTPCSRTAQPSPSSGSWCFSSARTAWRATSALRCTRNSRVPKRSSSSLSEPSRM